jgi:hypothetical protein
MIIQLTEQDAERALYWEPWADLREWLRDECKRFNAHPIVTALKPAPELSYRWGHTDFTLTYRCPAGLYTMLLVYSHELRGFSYKILRKDGVSHEQYVTARDGRGYFESPDHQMLTLEDVGQRILSLLITASKKPLALVC